MDSVLYWIWLTSKPIITPKKITSLLERFPTAEDIYRETEYTNIPNIGAKEISALRDKSMSGANRIKNTIDNMGARIITFEDEAYPNKLRNIIPPPYILYVRGDMDGLDEVLTIAVIGSRKYTPYGKMATMRLSSALARSGAVVVGGLARGLDGVAAESALRAGGRTIAVIGSGLDVMYPPENKGLMEEIAKNGAVITEYPPGSAALAEHFPARNRIIAGLSNGVLVTEARRKSGTLITARQAMEYGRDLFAVPGNINEPNYEGSHRLIQQGAKLTATVNDILEEYPYAVREMVRIANTEDEETETGGGEPDHEIADSPEREAAESQPAESVQKTDDVSELKEYSRLSETDKRIVSLLMKSAMNIDEMSRVTQISAGTINVRLTLLEMKKLVRRLPGGDYELNT